MIRLATIDDLVSVRSLLDELDEHHRVNLPWLLRTPEPTAEPVDVLSEFLSDSNRTALIAETEEGAVVGVALVFLRATSSAPVLRPARIVEIDALAVRAGSRRRGVGTALMRAVQAWAVERGGSWIELGVYEFNEGARKFYQSLGFETLSRRLRQPLTSASE